ncbi:RPS18 [Ecytonucleospora hepatopenaei]|uniref:RPS18 n=1 Tax=Ecytonucleospora hepatopenaei TaxID=646526 RepID=A0A1W0E4X0_9MICR|nr:RPS18 [Ecytonucleospora hepatopenaei]
MAEPITQENTKNEVKKSVKKFDADTMQHIIRLYNTNIDGTKKVTFALTRIRGVGMRFARAIVLKAGIDHTKFAGELNLNEIDEIQKIIENPKSYGIPEYFLNHQKDIVTGESEQLVGIKIDGELRFLMEKAKKFKEVKGCRLAIGLRCNGQRTRANGRRLKAFAGKKK